MLTELDRSVFIGIVSGFTGGFSQSFLDDFFSLKIDKKIISRRIIISKSLLLGFFAGIIFGMATFTLANWDTNMSIVQLNRWSIFVTISLPLSVILNRILPLHSIFLHLFSRKNKINN